MSVSTVDNTSTFFPASVQQQSSCRFMQKDSFLARCIHHCTYTMYISYIKQRRREPLMIPHCFLLCLFSDFSFYLSYAVPAISHILNEEVLPSSSLQSFPKYFPSRTGLSEEKEGKRRCSLLQTFSCSST